MLREETIAKICRDAAAIFEHSTEQLSPEDIVATETFARIRVTVQKEAALTDKQILELLMRHYSDKLRAI